MGIKKNILKFLSEPTCMTIDQIHGILIACGYELDRIKGKGILTIPVHQRKIKKIYLQGIRKTVIEEIGTLLL